MFDNVEHGVSADVPHNSSSVPFNPTYRSLHNPPEREHYRIAYIFGVILSEIINKCLAIHSYQYYLPHIMKTKKNL